MTNSKYIKKCRLCGSGSLAKVLNFGKVPLGNNLGNTEKFSLRAREYPLNLVKCKSCSHFQINFSVSPNELYTTNYTYLSGIAESFLDHFEKYALWIKKKCKLKDNDIVLDVGSNDGSCLKEFKKNKLHVLGVDPAKIPSDIANKNGIKTINAFFDDKNVDFILKKYGQVDFITSHNVLAHIDNISDVFKNIHRLLKTESFFCFEVGYFVKVLENNYFDTIYHEHLDYHHAKPLVKFLVKLGFSIVNISTNKIQGGSIRILCKKNEESKIYLQPKNFLLKERKTIINNKIFIKNWNKHINDNAKLFEKMIKSYSKEGKRIIGYGAPTKATLLIKISNLKKNIISGIIEDNVLKVGRFMPQTDIPIINFDKKSISSCDVIIIFAWNFFNDIIKRLKKNKISGITVVIPLPKIRVIHL